MTNFIFCLHDHQPVGNFDFVLERAYARCYYPVVASIYTCPELKLSLHTSGFLLDWLAEHHPEYIEFVREMVDRGQVEIVGGAYYEPILSVIPMRDGIGQIEMMSDRLEELFGVRPRGLWLAERVWDQRLPDALSRTGMEYVVLDDYHLLKGGVGPDDMGGFFITEELGRTVNVFAGSERLRYLIPFKPVGELKGFLSANEEADENLRVYADDGEKFGVWPGTYDWVFEQGWFDRFLNAVPGLLGEVNYTTFAERLDRSRPIGRVYPPTTSYMEMGAWTLPAYTAADFDSTLSAMDKADPAQSGRFVQGGTWRGFFAKYPESNWMHKRMLLASEAVDAADGASAESVRHLYRAQCNDAYWHGVFGGLYLPHLRSAVYENILRAEGSLAMEGASAKEELSVSTVDIDADGAEEIIVSSSELNLFISPADGGELSELDFKPACVNLSNTLSRWFESYHIGLAEKLEAIDTAAAMDSDSAGDDGGVKSIHDTILVKQEGLSGLLFFDSEKRTSFVEHFLEADAELEDIKSGVYPRAGGLVEPGYGAELTGRGARLTARVLAGVDGYKLTKEYAAEGARSFKVSYLLEPESTGGATEMLFAVETNFILPACDGPATRYAFHPAPGEEFGLNATGRLDKIERVEMVDSYTGIKLTVENSGGGLLWFYPVETVTQSEAGFERIFQGSSLLFVFPVGPKSAKGPLKADFLVSVDRI